MLDPLDHETPERDILFLLSLVDRVRQSWKRPEVIEVGAWAGITTIRLADVGAIVHAIDHWKGNPADRLGELAKRYGPENALETFCSNAGWRLFKSVWPHVGDSLFWAGVWPRPMDLVFIDADHRYESVRADIHSWSRHVRSGGILCGHDYPGFEGVKRAADELGIDGHESNVWYKVM